MSTETVVQEALKTQEVVTISGRVQSACDIATGRSPADDAATGTRIIGAKKDLNCKGRGPQWYRMVYRRSWQYVASERLPSGSFLASERRSEVHGNVYPGEIVVSHDRGRPVDAAWLVLTPDSDGKVLRKIEFASRRDGQLAFRLPDGSEVVLPNPRA